MLAYKNIAAAVIKQAMYDIVKFRRSKKATNRRIYDDAVSFLNGNDMMRFWCSVLELDPSAVSKGALNGNVHPKL